ncbi:cupin [Aquisalinus flavus]|uniref:Cupin n=2 Tax=Aquisalinus flavus TaxID=1526572 RepID=A0A8J2V5T3_9PROT|nr:cupin [Aquisalinus flavus]
MTGIHTAAMTDDIWNDTPSVPVYHDVDRALFENEIKPANCPVLMKGLGAHWPLVEKGRQGPEALAAYLRSHANTQPVQAFIGAAAIEGRFAYTDDLKGFNFERQAMPVGDLLDALLARLDEEGDALYAGGIPVPAHLPTMDADNPMPLLEPGSDRLVSAWIGNRTRIPAHWDLPQNIAVVAAGRRRYTLFPIEQVANLYVGPLDLTLAGQPSSLVDFHAPDFGRFPKFREAMKAAQIADLEPGDAVYVPPMWWHHVESFTSFGMLMNYWWREGPDYMVTPFFTLLHALTTLRDLPAPERAAWRVMFDHYIFRLDGEPMDHVPMDARGIFADMTPDNLRRLKGFLASKLQ